MKRWLVPTAVLASIFAAAAPAAAAPSGPPISLEGVEITRQCGVQGSGGFLVTGVLSGSFKDITLPSGTILSPSPALKVTLTAENGNTVSYVITGVTRVTTFTDRTEVVATGRNLISRPNIGGLYITSGNVSFTNNPDGSEQIPFSGPGRVIDVCDVLS
ncbi:hypothetical protein [Arthrobacter oryzae]|uniref:hypothetical protein n=1 Tax=Arthrobacter oryzae TaxID=409290 RepID=UPI00286666BD|nr:hypothetical protein [Arthrobacter oryzae]MDR6506281.1 hypothetical protein [Arthrobacter oryzae]